MKLAILGASFLQRPLVERVNAMGIESHVFAWREGNVVEDIATAYYPISIVDQEAILEKCQTLDVDGVITVGSDVAISTVNFVAEHLGLPGNSIECAQVSRDKHLMRERLNEFNLPVPKFHLFEDGDELPFEFPFMVKATDRSGSRGVALVHNSVEFEAALLVTQEVSFNKKVLIEEYFEGRQFSLEFISDHGQHTFVALTEEFFTGPPHFVEMANVMPGRMEDGVLKRAISLTKEALNALSIQQGASHVELRYNDQTDQFCFIEIGARMGGDFRSKLVEVAYGIDFLCATVNAALGQSLSIESKASAQYSFIKWFSSEKDQESFAKAHSFSTEQEDSFAHEGGSWQSSADRSGYIIGATSSFPDFLSI